MNSLTENYALRSLLERLHQASDAQDSTVADWVAPGDIARPTGFEPFESESRGFYRDKFVAIERDKGQFCYSVCRAVGATRVVEAGTSFGVSTLYLAAAVHDNGGGAVIGTEYEPTKAVIAEQHFLEAGLSEYIDLRVGDVLETLQPPHLPIDFILLDIWGPIAGRVLALLGPHVRLGGVVIADNIVSRSTLYGELIQYLDDPANGFATQALPFDGGLAFAVKTGAV